MPLLKHLQLFLLTWCAFIAPGLMAHYADRHPPIEQSTLYSLDAYIYVHQNPWTKYDPEGLSEDWEWSAWDLIPGVQVVHAVSDLIGDPIARHTTIPMGAALVNMKYGISDSESGAKTAGQSMDPRVRDPATKDSVQTSLIPLVTAMTLPPGNTLTGWAADPESGAAALATQVEKDTGDVAAFNAATKDAAAMGSPSASAKATNAVQAYEVGAAKDLQVRSIVGDGLDIDHQPSKAALIKAATDAKGRNLTPAERQAVIDNGTAVAVPKAVHQAGPTYAGKNTPAQISADSQTLSAAAVRDSSAMVQNAPAADKAAAQNAAKQVQAANSN